jgi:hypothetical protein
MGCLAGLVMQNNGLWSMFRIPEYGMRRSPNPMAERLRETR